jgi:hypothetical protein
MQAADPPGTAKPATDHRGPPARQGSSSASAPAEKPAVPDIGCQLGCCNSALISARCGSTALAAALPPYAPTARYEVRQLRGWRVLVHQDLLQREPALCAQTLELLDHHLYDIVRHVPAAALDKLRQIAIWVELDEPHHKCMAFHPDAGWLREHDMNPEKAGGIEIANARNFLRWTLDQPAMVLHELAHGYHHRFLERGFDNPAVLAAYRHAQDAKLYEAVLRRGNCVERAYAATNPMEYFAETSESLFGTNDFYPFVIVELQRHDPQMYELLKKLWGVK